MRFIVIVSESHAVISSERSSEDGLLDLCASGAARESAHMRSACMHATSDRAAPAFVRALTRGAYTFVRELYMLLSVPFHTLSFMSVFGLISVLPSLGLIRGIFARNVDLSEGRDPYASEHTIVVLNGERSKGLTEGSLTHRKTPWPMLEDISETC